jgi:uncharacterized membrane protein
MNGNDTGRGTGNHELLRDYLERLDAATADLPAEARDDLRTDVRAHLDEVVAQQPSETDLRAAIDRLGAPEAMAAEVRTSMPPPSGAPMSPARPSAAPTSSAGRDVTTVICILLLPTALMLLFSVVGLVLGTAIAWGLLWSSRTWTTGEKLVGTLVWPGGLVLPALLALLGGQVCTSEVDAAGGVVTGTEVCEGFALPIWAGIPAMLLTVLAPLLVGAWLLHRGGQRRAGA